MEWINKIITTWIVGSLGFGIAWVLLIEMYRFNFMKKILKGFWDGLILSSSFMMGRQVKTKELIWFFVLLLAASWPIGTTMAIRDLNRTINSHEWQIQALTQDLQVARRDLIILYSIVDSTEAASRIEN